MTARAIDIFCPNWVGDVVMGTPAFRALRRRFSDAHITAAAGRNTLPVLEDTP